MRRRRVVLLVALLVSVNSVADDGLIIAVASNFQSTAREIAAEFTQATHIPVRISAGSTGKLYVQILNGAPYDIFLAADTERPRLLEKSGVAVAGSLSTYAIGALVLVSADPTLQDADCSKLLIDGNYRKIAIANPRTAPYGAAAKDYLQRAGLWKEAKSRMIMGENILQTFQFVATANATLGIVAASLLTVTAKAVDIVCRWPLEIPDTSVLHQGAVILSRASDRDVALSFMKFLRSERARDLISSHGYEVPAH